MIVSKYQIKLLFLKMKEITLASLALQITISMKRRYNNKIKDFLIINISPS